MNRDSFLLGFIATSGQVLLLRELITAFGGTELFVGTALFGWLMWVALGAWFGGRSLSKLDPHLLFVLAVFLVPVTLVGARLMPLLVASTIGEAIPLTTAIPLSIVVVAPVGLLAGWLFPAVARQGRVAGNAVTSVYLFEGLGAFAAGVFLTALMSLSLGNLGISYATGLVLMLAAAIGPSSHRWMLILAATVVLILMIASGAGRTLDYACDQAKFAGYSIERSFDTPYGHQVLLSRDSTIVLVTDNSIEATSFDLETSENLLIPPLVYCPTANSVLLVGRAEFGLGQLASQLPGLRVTAVDPRSGLTRHADFCLPTSPAVSRVDLDPVAFLSGSSPSPFNIVVLHPGRFDTYRNSRLVTPAFLELIKRSLQPEGVLILATNYDTDRYVSPETAELLATMTSTLKATFAQVIAWPGNTTLILASDQADLTLSLDTILARIERLPYQPSYVSASYLFDRLSILKSERLAQVLAAPSAANSIETPRLSTLESWYRAKASNSDRVFARIALGQPYWLIALPIGLLGFFWWVARGRSGGRSGLFLYVTAGLVSLSLELISFYVFQSTVGSLYVHLAMLVGVFMLGLAWGTWLASRTIGLGIGRLSLATLLAAVLVFAVTWHKVDLRLALVYHLSFLLVVALATGSLFVAATRQYYDAVSDRNRGLGYAAELGGSAIGALITTAILLPILGANWLLLSLAGILVLALFCRSPQGFSRPRSLRL